MKSGFGGFNKLSSTSTGKTSYIDSLGTIDRAIKTILGDEDVIIFTTAVPSTIFVDSVGIYRWSALNYNKTDLYLSQSTNTAKLTLSDTYKLGNYSSVYSIGGTQWMRYENTPGTFTTKRNTFAYFGWVEYPTTTADSPVLRHNNSLTTHPSGTVGWGASGYTSFNSGDVRLSYTINISTTGTLNRFIRVGYTTASSDNSQIVFGNTGSNVFRLTEEIYDSSNRAVTSSYYDENKNLISPSTSPINMQWLASVNNLSFTFTPTSLTASTAGWDKNFPYNSFPPLTGGIGISTTHTGKLAHHTIIQSLSNTIYNAGQVQSLKTLLDQIYGV